jgi:hypothetical protein
MERDYAIAEACQSRTTLSRVEGETELSSLLVTITQQAHETNALVGNIFSRVYPQAGAESCAEKQAFNGGYVGMAEQIRSTQRAAIELLHQLAKLV